MTDRVVQYPARYQLVLVAGTTDTYDLVAVPGTVAEAGTDLNVANLLSAPTAAKIATAMGVTAPTTPNEALNAMAVLPIYSKLMEITVASNSRSVSLDLSSFDLTKYTSIKVASTIESTDSDLIKCTINNKTSGYWGSYFTDISLIGQTNAAAFGSFSNANGWAASHIELEIWTSYSGVNSVFKCLFSSGANGSGTFGQTSNSFTAPLTSIQFNPATGYINAGSKFYVYGVRK